MGRMNGWNPVLPFSCDSDNICSVRNGAANKGIDMIV